MKNGKSILFVGESCFATVTEHKGIDKFSETNYHMPAGIMVKMFEELGHEVTHIPCHLVSREYPKDIDSLMQYDIVLFSDIGTNTFLLLPEVVREGKRAVNLLSLTKEYVEKGGGFGMIGGYMTFQGMEGKGKWKDSVIEEILPVNLIYGDDRVEVPEGADLCCVPDSHQILHDMPEKWPYILGYNKLTAKESADVLVEYNGDPIISVSEYKKGKTLAYATDCTPHWAPKAMHGWEHYPALWGNIINWLGK